MKVIPIRKFPIKLGQFLKLSELAQDGLEAKLMIVNGLVKINGQIINERGKKIMENDIIEIESYGSYKAEKK